MVAANLPGALPLVAIVGPTAVGKSALAMSLALQYRGEIISADSRQLYEHMDIGTAKPTPEERQAVPHHLVDFLEPDQEYTLADYQEAVHAAVADISSRGALPMLVGGTGLYVRAALGGFGIPRVAPRPDLRRELEAYAAARGAEALHRRLAEVDPAAAVRIDYRNVRRVVRALEVFTVTGQPISGQQEQTPPPWRVLRLGLTRERDDLYRRIDERVDWMIEHGLVEETEGLVARGFDCDLPALSSLGYRQVCQYLRGELTLAQAVNSIKTRTHRFARQQYTWFRLDDERIHWFAAGADAGAEASRLLERFLAEEGAG
jgi:tRNA dimethylallyltransferase